MRKHLAFVLTSALVFSGLAACTTETTSSAPPEAIVPAVQREGARVRIAVGDDEAISTQSEGRRKVDYYEAGVWVGSVAWRADDRTLEIAAPGFTRARVVDAGVDPREARTALGITEQESARFLDRLLAVDAHLAGSPSLSTALARAGSTQSGVHPTMSSLCSSGGRAALCGILTLGLCGYWMIYDCLVQNDG